jgi:hypothetical protein
MTIANIRLIPDMNSQQDLPSVHGPAPSRVYQLAPMAFCFMAKEISLTNSNLKAIVDDEDFELVSKYRWQITALGYVSRCESLPPFKGRRRNRHFPLHRFVLGLEPRIRIEVDHRDRNKLNNQKKNLRIATRTQNIANTGIRKDKTTSLYKGVTIRRDSNRGIWQARFRTSSLGMFEHERDAAVAVDIAALRYFNDFAYLNFPELKEVYLSIIQTHRHFYETFSNALEKCGVKAKTQMIERTIAHIPKISYGEPVAGWESGNEPLCKLGKVWEVLS